MKSVTPVWLMAGLLALSPGVGNAQAVSQAPSYPASDLAGFNGNADSLTNAIDRVKSATGGRVLEIRYAMKDNVPGYNAAVAKGLNVVFVRLDDKSGKLTPVDESSRQDWMLQWQQIRDIHIAENASVSLLDAVRTAEQAQNNKPAVAAGIARSASNPQSDVYAYNVIINQGNGDITRVAVDSSNGMVIADPGMLNGP
jgi:hypothetical protein